MASLVPDSCFLASRFWEPEGLANGSFHVKEPRGRIDWIIGSHFLI